MIKNLIGTSLGLVLFGLAMSATAAPNSLTYQGRILKTDGSPLEYSNVSFSFEVTSPDGLCVLYREQVNGINMTNSGGVFDVAIGKGTKIFPTAASFKLLDAFVNAGSLDCDGVLLFLQASMTFENCACNSMTARVGRLFLLTPKSALCPMRVTLIPRPSLAITPLLISF
uniref:hypothetical protein n=1 Tax=Bdellovibrio bacteriovorus TaxID=959 RepID=UPI00403DAE8E